MQESSGEHTPKRRPTIAFFSALDLQEIRKWSWAGTFHYMVQALQRYCGDVFHLGPIVCEEQKLARAIHEEFRVTLGKNFTYRYCIMVAKKYAEIAAQRLAERAFDIVIAPTGATEIAFLETAIPIVLIEDATYGQLIDYHQEFSNLAARAISELNTIELLALNNARVVVSSSTWAKQSAIDTYGIDRQKIHVLPFGANLECPPAQESVFARKKSDRCRLLYVGANWVRKGGDIAFETLLALEERGVQAELIVCGCTPPTTCVHERLKVFSFLDKNDLQQSKELERLYMTADFLLLPTRNDCTPIAFCEANAFGLPVITTNTGGIAEIIKDGENGFMLPYHARGEAYAAVIAEIYHDSRRYAWLVESSRQAFESRLNWDAWGLSMQSIIAELLGSKEH